MTMAWYPHYLSDYESDTTHLSLMEHGAYRLLLDHYYKKQKALPANASILHRVCRAFADDEQAAVRRVLDEFFVLKEDGYHQKRADEEIIKTQEISAKRSAAAQTRYTRRNNLPSRQSDQKEQKPADANALQMQNKSTANADANAMQVHTQLTTHIKKESADAAKSISEQFKDLVEFTGGSREGAASYLGKCKRDYPADEVEKAAAVTVLRNAEDPKAYMTKLLSGGNKKPMSKAEMNRAGGGVVV